MDLEFFKNMSDEDKLQKIPTYIRLLYQIIAEQNEQIKDKYCFKILYINTYHDILECDFQVGNTGGYFSWYFDVKHIKIIHSIISFLDKQLKNSSTESDISALYVNNQKKYNPSDAESMPFIYNYYDGEENIFVNVKDYEELGANKMHYFSITLDNNVIRKAFKMFLEEVLISMTKNE